MISTSGKCCCGGDDGFAQCQAASGVGAPDWERGEGLARQGGGGRAGGAGLGRRGARDPLEGRAEF